MFYSFFSFLCSTNLILRDSDSTGLIFSSKGLAICLELVLVTLFPTSWRHLFALNFLHASQSSWLKESLTDTIRFSLMKDLYKFTLGIKCLPESTDLNFGLYFSDPKEFKGNQAHASISIASFPNSTFNNSSRIRYSLKCQKQILHFTQHTFAVIVLYVKFCMPGISGLKSKYFQSCVLFWKFYGRISFLAHLEHWQNLIPCSCGIESPVSVPFLAVGQESVLASKGHSNSRLMAPPHL